MDIHNYASWTRLTIENIGWDIVFTWNDQRYGIISTWVMLWWPNWSHLQGSNLWRNILQSLNDICMDTPATQLIKLSSLPTGSYAIRWDSTTPNSSSKIRIGITNRMQLIFWLSYHGKNIDTSFEKIEFLVDTGLNIEEYSWILVVTDNQFQHFLNLALAIQLLHLSPEYLSKD